jgi:phage/plasmid-like protein (TIGR03299 family)
MAHEITKNAITGDFEFAYRADHGAPWHVGETGIERAMPVESLDDLDMWKRHSGMLWEAKRSRVRFGEGPSQRTWDDHHVLFRNDTKSPLGIVTPKYNIVQPGQMFDLFRGIIGVGGLQLSAAGTTFGGREFWATAKFGEGTVGSRKDMVQGFVLIHSSLDGSRATTVRRVMERAVCNNTIQMAFGEHQAEGAVFKCSHRSLFNPEAARTYMGLNMDAWNAAKASMLRLANKAIDARAAEAFVIRLLAPTQAAAMDTKVQDKIVETTGFKTILGLFNGEGKGSQLDGVAGTAWGALNAVTEYADHHVRATSDVNRWDSAQFGPGATLKAKAFALLTA